MSVLAPRAASEALFGSTSRGEADALSDRDVLIVDDDIGVLRARGAELSRNGASVASYTFAKLEALAGKGALFLQHLKIESRIYVDRDGRLRRLLSDFRPRSDYSLDIAANARLAALAGVVPSGSRGLLYAADVLYVAVRNYGVLALAQKGVHTYGFQTVVAEMERAGLVSHGAASALSSLRFLKCLYRSGEASGDGAVEKTIRRALEVLPPQFFPGELQIEDPRAVVLASWPCSETAYVELRDLERRWLALRELEPGLVQQGRLSKLQRWIENPRVYSSISARLAPTLRGEMRHLSQSLEGPVRAMRRAVGIA